MCPLPRSVAVCARKIPRSVSAAVFVAFVVEVRVMVTTVVVAALNAANLCRMEVCVKRMRVRVRVRVQEM